MTKILKNIINGWLAIDKPEGMNSTRVVSIIKKLIRPTKIGHAGTLDPMATGVLPIAIGEATKTVQFAMGARKKYLFTIHFGTETDSFDKEGKITKSGGKFPNKNEILEKIPEFIGDIEQTPPAFSAIKVDGERSYDLARKGQAVKLKSRKVKIYALNLVSQVSESDFEFEVECGKGTYVRAIARDLSYKLDTYGHLIKLRRSQVGKFNEKNLISLEKLEDLVHNGELFKELLPVDSALDDIPVLEINAANSSKIRNGQLIFVEGIPNAEKACVKYDNKVVAVGTINEEIFKPERVFNL